MTLLQTDTGKRSPNPELPCKIRNHYKHPTTPCQGRENARRRPENKRVAFKMGLGFKALSSLTIVAEWIHFTLLGDNITTIKLKVYTLGGL